MAYRIKGIPDELFGNQARLNTLSIPGLLSKAGATGPPVAPVQQNQDIMTRIAAGLGVTPEVAVPPEAAQALGPEGVEGVRREEKSIGNQGLLSILLALAGLAAPVSLIPAALLGSTAMGRTARLRGEVGEAETRRTQRRKEAVEETPPEATERRGLERDLLRSRAEEDRATATMRKNRDAVIKQAQKFEGRLIEMRKQLAAMQTKGQQPSQSWIDEYNFTIDAYNAALMRSQNLGMMMLQSLGTALPGGAPAAPQLQKYTSPASPAPAAGVTPAGGPPPGYTEPVGRGFCKPGTNDCWMPD